MRVSELIKLIPTGETQDAVYNAFDRHNQAIREALRSKTRFNLQIRSLKNSPLASETKIPVDRGIGYPQEFEFLEIPPDMVLAARLSLHTSEIWKNLAHFAS